MCVPRNINKPVYCRECYAVKVNYDDTLEDAMIEK